jgi:quinol monooxygenase YgiN
MYAAILHVAFPPDRQAEVVRYLAEEMLPVIRANPGFLDFRVLDAGTPGELVLIDTWERREDSARAAQRPEAMAVHARYADLGLSVTSAGRYAVVAQGGVTP